MPRLVLLNGPPGIGKSTLARRYAEEHPPTVALDIDVIRQGIEGWQHDADSKRRARAEAVLMAESHLDAGRDVVIPQLVGDPAFVAQLRDVAQGAGATFEELLLVDEPAEVVARFEARRAALTGDHPEREATAGGVLEVLDVLLQRSGATVVATRAGAIEEAYAAVVHALHFEPWRRRLIDAVSTGGDMDVPCGTCTACCRSSMFVHIEPDETDTLARIPKALLVHAPGRPRGHVVLGYDENGCCPMLVDGGCSIYDHRPRTCRLFDCRVYAAAGLSPVHDGKPLIATRVVAWPGPDRRVSRAVSFLRANPECFTDGVVPAQHAQLAVAALVVSPLFEDEAAEPTPSDVRKALAG